MKLDYLIRLVELKSGENHLISVSSLDDLSTFLAHIDNEVYALGDVTTISPIHTEYGQFIKKDTKLEHGGEK